jgi:hypothetical protein
LESSETVKEEDEARIWVILGGNTYIDVKWQVQREVRRRLGSGSG